MHYLKRCLLAATCCMTVLGTGATAFAAPVDNATTSETTTEASTEAVAETKDVTTMTDEELSQEAESLSELIDSAEDKAVETSDKIDELNETLEGLGTEKEDAQNNYNNVKAIRDSKYEEAKKYVQLSYEKTESDVISEMIDSLNTGKGIVDFLAKYEYISEINDSNTDKLRVYQEDVNKARDVLDKIIEEETQATKDLETLEAQKAELETKVEGYEEELQEVEDEQNSRNTTSAGYYSESSYDGELTSEEGAELVEYASQFIGGKYVFGGSTLPTVVDGEMTDVGGIDCSGFVSAIYAHFGYSLPHSSGSMRSCGREVSLENIMLGDIVCYSGHVGIYAGDGEIINASNSKPYPKGGIKMSNMFYSNIITIRRILPDPTPEEMSSPDTGFANDEDNQALSDSPLTRRKGVVYFDGHRETYYSQKVLPGNGLSIPGRHVCEFDGTVRDEDGYICVASNDYSKGTVLKTSLGYGKVYDSGCASGTVDIYCNW